MGACQTAMVVHTLGRLIGRTADKIIASLRRLSATGTPSKPAGDSQEHSKYIFKFAL